MPLKGSDNAEQIWNWLVGQGMSNQAAAGIMGNMKQESGFEPRIIQGGELADDCPASSYDGPEGAVGYGLCQWTGSRSKNLVAFAAAKGSILVILRHSLNSWKKRRRNVVAGQR